MKSKLLLIILIPLLAGCCVFKKNKAIEEVDLILYEDSDYETEIVPIPISTYQSGDEIFMVVEESPKYIGGDEARIKFLQNNIQYPEKAREVGISGTIIVTFVVEKDGSLTDIRILRGIGGGCDEEAVRVIKLMPNWNPGKQRGKAVRVQFNMPVKFTLED